MIDTSESIAKQVALHLLKIGAISISSGKPYVWSSGIKSPVYCDNRLTLSHPKIREFLIDGFVKKAARHDIDCIAGVATGGIAHAALIADRLSLPLVYVRPKPKGHGHENQIEGFLPKNSKVLLIEDLVATGRSTILVADAIQAFTGFMPVATLAIFTYNLLGVKDLFENKEIPFETLSDFDSLLEVAFDSNYIDSGLHDSLVEWRNDYHTWALKH